MSSTWGGGRSGSWASFSIIINNCLYNSALLVSTQLLITIGAKVDCVFTGVHNVRNPATENASQEPESTGGTNSASPNFMSNS